jgi:hypothetical protein
LGENKYKLAFEQSCAEDIVAISIGTINQKLQQNAKTQGSRGRRDYKIQIPKSVFTCTVKVFCPCRSALVSPDMPDHHSAKKVFIVTMKLWKM